MTRWDPSDPGGHFEGEPEERIAELEQERNRLAADLLASQGRETGLRGAIEDALSRIMTVWSSDAEREVGFDGSRAEADLQAALASPSPVAQAIGRVLEAAQALDEKASDPGCQFLVASDFNRLHNELAYLRLARQALRSGQASPGEEG